MKLTEKQQAMFNRLQVSGLVHPWTCIDRTHQSEGVLVARDGEIRCPECGWRDERAEQQVRAACFHTCDRCGEPFIGRAGLCEQCENDFEAAMPKDD